MAGLEDISKNLIIETLVAATAVGTTPVDDAWIDIGVPVRMTVDNRLILYYDLVVNDSTGVQVRFVPCKTVAGTPYPAFNAAMDTWPLGAVDEGKWIQFNAEAFLWIQIQCKATVVGPGPGTLALDFSRVRV